MGCKLDQVKVLFFSPLYFLSQFFLCFFLSFFLSSVVPFFRTFSLPSSSFYSSTGFLSHFHFFRFFSYVASLLGNHGTRLQASQSRRGILRTVFKGEFLDTATFHFNLNVDYNSFGRSTKQTCYWQFCSLLVLGSRSWKNSERAKCLMRKRSP